MTRAPVRRRPLVEPERCQRAGAGGAASPGPAAEMSGHVGGGYGQNCGGKSMIGRRGGTSARPGPRTCGRSIRHATPRDFVLRDTGVCAAGGAVLTNLGRGRTLTNV